MDRWFGATFGQVRANSLEEFVDRVQGHLSAAMSFRQITESQQQAWRESGAWVWEWIHSTHCASDEWLVLFEYATPLVTSRPDLVIVTRECVLVVEFKTGDFTSTSARKQVLGYAQDLYWFHPGTRSARVIALLVHQLVSPLSGLIELQESNTLPSTVIEASPAAVSQILEDVANSESKSSRVMDADLWLRAQYRPRPSIVDAAVALFAQTDDPGISTAFSDDDDLDRATKFLVEQVHDAADQRTHHLVLLSGVPGAGKTLVGLRLAYDKSVVSTLRTLDSNPLYLSGNGPLVQVLTEALARDATRRDRSRSLDSARRQSGTLIKLVHSFTRDGLSTSSHLSVPHVTIFDEGQRVWNAQQMAKKHSLQDDLAVSEPDVILRNLEGQDWAVVVVLIGEGQEINQGESGVHLWLEAVQARKLAGNRNWKVSGSPLLAVDSPMDAREQALFLGHSRRSESASWLSTWVAAVIDGETAAASNLIQKGAYPILVTRDLEAAKLWLRRSADRSRSGLLASARASRLRPYGIETSAEFLSGVDWRNWFLDRPPSLESSCALEVAASEFKCQGLELDYTCVCWSWDMVRPFAGWQTRRLRSRSLDWQVQTEERRRFHLNAYRVLLTRARAGMVIWIPVGSADDPTRDREEMDEVYEYFKACGVPDLVLG